MKGEFNMTDNEKRAHDLALLCCKRDLDSELADDSEWFDPDSLFETYEVYYDFFLTRLAK